MCLPSETKLRDKLHLLFNLTFLWYFGMWAHGGCSTECFQHQTGSGCYSVGIRGFAFHQKHHNLNWLPFWISWLVLFYLNFPFGEDFKYNADCLLLRIDEMQNIGLWICYKSFSSIFIRMFIPIPCASLQGHFNRLRSQHVRLTLRCLAYISICQRSTNLSKPNCFLGINDRRINHCFLTFEWLTLSVDIVLNTYALVSLFIAPLCVCKCAKAEQCTNWILNLSQNLNCIIKNMDFSCTFWGMTFENTNIACFVPMDVLVSAQVVHANIYKLLY